MGTIPLWPVMLAFTLFSPKLFFNPLIEWTMDAGLSPSEKGFTLAIVWTVGAAVTCGLWAENVRVTLPFNTTQTTTESAE